MKARKAITIIAMLVVVVMGGCKKDEDPGIRPRVTSTNPISNAVGVAINSKISAKFSTVMDPSSIAGERFILQQGTSAISGTVTNTDSTATFTPAANLAPNTVFTATIKAGAKDNSGKTLAGDYVWSFTTGATPDTTKPTVTLTDPANNALAVTLNHLVAVTFSEAMDPTSITALTFTLKQGTTSVSGAVTYTGTKATFTPAINLEAGKVYTATITTGAKDMAGNAIATNYTFSFVTVGTVPDTTPPVVNTTDPSNNATGVAANKLIKLTFSEAMNPLTITTSTFTLMQGTTAVAGSVSYSANIATFTPSSALALGLTYTATISTGAKDVAGNALVSGTVWNFTTVPAPIINAIDPLNNATGVGTNRLVKITFGQEMDPLTITTSTFTLMQGTTAVTGTVSYSAKIATFTPSSALATSLVYMATISTGAKDLAGNALAASTVWSFTTGTGSGSLVAAVDLGSAINYVILAKTAINNIPTSAITGDLGLSPAAESFITGFALTAATGYATSPQVTGKIYAADQASPTPINLTTAVNDMITAYNDAAGRPSPDFLELGTGNIGGKILAPGLYKWTNTVTLPSAVTISGGANDVWIFQIAGDLTMSNTVNITLIGAQAKNIFWQVAGTVSIGTTAHFEGIILSKTGITFQTGASMNGRALAQTAVILDGNAITKP